MLRWLVLAATCGWLVSAAACNRIEARPDAPVPRGPSVLLVTVDTLRADHVGAYGAGDARTPTLDALAAEGIRFETAIASSPLTLPSHASIHTGHYPPSHGVRHNGIFRLEDSAETLAERLRAAGYATAAVVSAYVLAGHFGLEQGFEVYDDRMSAQPAVPGGFLERSARATTERALAWLEQSERPFFLWVHYYDPHADYAPPSPWDERFAERPYNGEIAYVDSELGRLLDALRKSGRLEHTLVVVTSDHGEALGEHSEATHSYTLYDATLAVPLLLRGPGVPAGRSVAGVVRTVDVAPTVLGLLGLPPFAGSDGEDLAPLWQGKEAAPRVAYAETLATEYEHGWSPLFAARSATHHFVRAPRPELYEVHSDPRQLVDLVERDPEAVAGMVAELEASIERALSREEKRAVEPIDARTRSRLAALGYTIPEAPVAASGIDPKDGLVWLGRYFEALQLVNANQLEPARVRLEEMLTAVPTSAVGHALLARIHVLQGRSELALPHAEKATQLLPSAAQLAQLGDVKVHLGDRAGAKAAYRAAAEQDEHEPLAQAGLMWIALQTGDPDAAEAHAGRALELNPSSVGSHQAVANVWEQAGEYERALEIYRAALRLDPASEQSHMHLAIQYARLGRSAESAEHLRRAGAYARVPHLRNRLGIVHAARGDVARAEEIFRGLIQDHPEYATARRNLATLERQVAGRPPADRPAGPTAAPRGSRD